MKRIPVKIVYGFCSTKYDSIPFPGAQNLAYLKRHPLNNELFGFPGASIFAHLRVGGFVIERSIGVPDFQVCKTTHT